jgi:hypothetical protein
MPHCITRRAFLGSAALSAFAAGRRPNIARIEMMFQRA